METFIFWLFSEAFNTWFVPCRVPCFLVLSFLWALSSSFFVALLLMLLSSSSMGSVSDDSVYLLSRDKAETERYVPSSRSLFYITTSLYFPCTHHELLLPLLRGKNFLQFPTVPPRPF